MASAIMSLERLQIPLEEVVKATNNFDDKYVIGEGGFGKVYRGQLSWSGKLENIVARRLDRKHGQGDVEFWTEISVLSSVEHENIISLIGFCDEKSEKIIINTREPKGSLSMYLSDPNLTFIQRLNICVGVARALRYIHNGEGRGYVVIHRNINSSTILLDDNFEAKLSGFEYSIKQSVDRMDQVVLSEAIGTTGYMDPSIEEMGGVTHKSDIYSFGVVLCEILCGRKGFVPDADNRLLAPLFIFHYENGSLQDLIHPDLHYQMRGRKLTEFVNVAYSCLKEDRVQRPNMNDIVIELEKILELHQQLEHLRKKLEHLKIPLDDIMLATDNFSEAYQIGVDRYYFLYKAELEHCGTENPSIREGKCNYKRAISFFSFLFYFIFYFWLKKTTKKQSDLGRTHNTVVIKRYLPGEEETFFTEIKMLSICKHPNIVKLLGFCYEGPEKIIIVEHLSNGFLADYWSNNGIRPILTWAKRLKICLDVANALNYIHTEMEDQKTIIHRDIKSKYIALDENWGAKIVDFGHSVFLPPNQDDEALYHNFMSGTLQYADPEYMMNGKLKRESDVYSFGVVLLEVLCGRLADDPIYLKESHEGLAFVARRCFQDGTPLITEDSGGDIFSLERVPNKDCFYTFVEILYKCIAETQNKRPTMNVVIQELRKALFFQEEQLQATDLVDVADEVEKDVSEDEDSSEVKESMELKLTNENSIKKFEHLKIPLSDIMLATDNFSFAYRIKVIAYSNLDSDLYKAELKHFGTKSPFIKERKNKSDLCRTCSTVVIKRFPPRTDDLGEEMFFTEFEMLTTCKHPSIVKIVGFCVEGSERILVVEHLSNGYLADYWWHTANDMSHILTWAKRLKICLDVANALNYLHTEMEDQKMIIHRDIKSRNIALDENWRAKIVDFRLSVFLPPNQDDDALYYSYFSGTREFMDPEYRNTGKLKRESDVYSFGVVLFEVICGRLAYDPIYLKESDKGLAFVARRCFREEKLTEMIDPTLKEQRGEKSFILNTGPNKDSLEKFVKIAHQCIAETQDQRPTMKVVIQELQQALFFQENEDDLIISLHDIELATESFHGDNCIGGGGFGKVYKGKVPKGDGFDTIVAKRLDTSLGQGEQQFRTELQILFEYKHENIITLVGYCDEKNEQIIVYEYASQGSLNRYLKDARLTWMKRLNICIDVATALDFIHGGAGKQAIVIHRDIKTENILLNDEWGAQLADFGLSLISPINKETDYVIDHACGTRGYLDPLYLKSGFLTKESDIYSFGVVLFEILCGRSTFEIRNQKGQFLPGFIKERFENRKHEDLVFEAIKEQIVPKALTAFQTIAYQCLHDDREKRPTSKELLRKLKEALEFQISGSNQLASESI